MICFYAIYDSIRTKNEIRTFSDASSLIESVPDDDRISELRKNANDEIIAWIELTGTKISYPVTQTTNNQYYLSHNFRKEYSPGGSVFVDYRNKLTRDDYAVIYGHNMDNALMFGEIHSFSNKDFFDEHRKGKIYLEDGAHELTVLAHAIVGNDNEYIYDVDAVANGKNNELIDYIKSRASNTALDVATPKRLLLLSTCYNHSNQRAVLLVGYN